MMGTLETQLIDIMKRILNQEDVSLKHRLVEDLGITSLDFIRLVVELEEKLEFRFDDEHLDMRIYSDVSSLFDYIQTQCQRKGGMK
jgi:acyl carrier protein